MFPTVRAITALALLLLIPLTLTDAQDPDHVVTLGNAAGSAGSSVSVAMTYDNTSVDALSGWSFAVCVDSSVGIATLVDQGADTAATNGGAGPDFHAPAVDPAPNLDGGWTVGVVISFAGMDSLAPGLGLELEVPHYDLVGSAGDSSPLEFCETLGMPLVFNTLVDTDGGAIDFTPVSGSVSILSDNTISLENVVAIVGSSVDVNVSIENLSEPLAGFQVAFTYDEAAVDLLSTTLVGPAAAAEFFQVSPTTGPGELAMGLVMDFSEPTDGMPGPLPVNVGPVAVLSFDVPAGTPPQVVPLTLTNGLGTPAVDNLVIVEGGFSDPGNLIDGSIEIVDFNEFVRGDCNDDGIVNIADGVYHLNFLFVPGSPDPICDDACDSNDDGDINAITDSVYTWNYRFLGGPPPPPPFPDPGIDPTPGDGIGCNGDADD